MNDGDPTMRRTGMADGRLLRQLRRFATILLLAASMFSASAVGAEPGKNSVGAGFAAPGFSVRDLEGKKLSLAGFRGKVVLLNFWATWCGPCLAELPRFSAWQAEYGAKGLQVIGISMDDDARPVRRLKARLRLSYPVAMGDERIGKLYGGVFGLPVTYLMGRDGKIRARFDSGADLNEMESQIKIVLAKP